MNRLLALLLLFNVLIFSLASGQDTLPKFSLVTRPDGKVLISWRNSFKTITQISIQRSPDSLKNFTTLLSVADPTIPENGFVDTKAPRLNMYYRLFIVLDNGNYLFSRPKRAVIGAVLVQQKEITPEIDDNTLTRIDNQRITYLSKNERQNMKVDAPAIIQGAPKIEIARIVFIKQNDSLIGRLSSMAMVRRFRDSILSKTRDTLVFASADTILIKSFVPKEVYKISSYVYTGKDGNIVISLPDADKKKYWVKFLEQDLSVVLEIKEIKKTPMIVDKTNFIHAGWFRFELYEDGKLKEKNKFFIPKDF
jgi:hypothetical protein